MENAQWTNEQEQEKRILVFSVVWKVFYKSVSSHNYNNVGNIVLDTALQYYKQSFISFQYNFHILIKWLIFFFLHFKLVHYFLYIWVEKPTAADRDVGFWWPFTFKDKNKNVWAFLVILRHYFCQRKEGFFLLGSTRWPIIYSWMYMITKSLYH